MLGWIGSREHSRYRRRTHALHMLRCSPESEAGQLVPAETIGEDVAHWAGCWPSKDRRGLPGRSKEVTPGPGCGARENMLTS